MFRTFAILFLLGVSAVSSLLRADEFQDFREFTDKRGQKITARLLSVSEDRRTMQIVRQDGRAFDSEINLLSLDDQQFVKHWMKQVPGPTPTAVAPSAVTPAALAPAAGSFRLEVTIARTNGGSETRRSETYKFETRQNRYRVNVRNLSRQDLEGARIEYAIVWRDDALVYELKDTKTWTFTTAAYENADSLVKVTGALPLETLRFNAGAGIETDSVAVDQVLYDNREILYADELIGIKVKVLSAAGQVLHESEAGSAAISSLTWDQIGGLPDPRRYDR